MAVKRTVTILVFMAFMGSIVSCTPEESARNDISGAGVIKQEGNARSPDMIQKDSRLVLLDSCTFQEALYFDWDFTIALVPSAINENTNLGVIVRQDNNWVGNYGGGFANTGVIGIDTIATGEKRFLMDIWKNEDPERPFAQRSPDTPTYRFYVDLQESDFRAAVRRGILEKRQVVVIQLKAYDMEGEPVGEWYRQLTNGK